VYASVQGGTLFQYTGDSGPRGGIDLDSSAWYNWLEQHSSFLFRLPFVHYTARKERRSSGLYWYAYRRHQGKLRTAYLGKTKELTLDRLSAVAEALDHTGQVDGPESVSSLLRAIAAHKPQASPAPPPLPVPLTPLVGRAQDVASVVSLLLCPDIRLVSLIGTGGVGKTRLALQVAADLHDHFADGVYFIPLAPVRDPHVVLRTIAQAFGFTDRPPVPLIDLLSAFLRGRDVLLVVDNFEQVMAATPLLVELLTNCPTLKMVVTSREILHLSAEHCFMVAPLSFPDPDQHSALDTLHDYPAVDLFLQRAQAIIPDMATNPATMLAIARVCARLEGLPLAIELAAARVRLLPPQALATRLNRRFDVLTEGGPDMPDRHKTLRATFTWSRDLLTTEEQCVFRRLSIFPDGCTLEAAEAVCSSLGDMTTPVLRIVSSLVDKSLVQTVSSEGQEPRLFLLETVREYALECLVESGEMERMQEAAAAVRSPHTNQTSPQSFASETVQGLPVYTAPATYRTPSFGTLRRPAGLTNRELQALLLVAEGLSNEQIACRLVISTATVKTYLSAIYNKLGVSSRTAAMRYAIDHRLQQGASILDS
jgi:predicted ATPase/DNA-binding CsgD family transcriptional regulator